MNKAFTKEDIDDPLIVPPRAPLPAGVVNYVTARGLALLRAERARLEAARSELMTDADRPRAAAISTRIADLDSRIASATLVDPDTLPHDEIRFGATALVRNEEGAVLRYRIVGVDEADVARGRIAFVAPLARALLGKHVGETAIVQSLRGDKELEIVRIDYTEDDPP